MKHLQAWELKAPKSFEKPSSMYLLCENRPLSKVLEKFNDHFQAAQEIFGITDCESNGKAMDSAGFNARLIQIFRYR